MTSPPEKSPLALGLPASAAVFVGTGLGRFAYTPLLPALVEAGWLKLDEAGYVGAANLAGYLAGALLTGAAGRWLGPRRAIQFALIGCVVGFAASAMPLGFGWLALWRFVVGIGGAWLNILAPGIAMARVTPAKRGLVSGIAFFGIGIGVVFSGVAMPLLVGHGLSVAWGALAVMSIGAAALAWRGWPERMAPVVVEPGTVAPARLPRVAIALATIGYFFDAAGFVPESLFIVAYAAHDLGWELHAAARLWVAVGIGAALGPLLILPTVIGRIGFGRGLALAFLSKAIVSALPLVTSSAPVLLTGAAVFGMFMPGVGMLAAGTALALGGAASGAALWRWMTVAFALGQTAGGYGFSGLFAITRDYPLMFASGAGLLLFSAALAYASTRMAKREV